MSEVEDEASAVRRGWVLAVLVIVIVAVVAGSAYYLFLRSGGGKKADLVIYAYDSFVSYNLAGATIHKFEEMYGVKVDVRTYGDAGSVIAQVIAEGEKTEADILLGVDNSYLAKVLNADILTPYKPQNIQLVPEHLIFDESYHVIPFDYGYIAIVYDTETISDPPRSFQNLTEERWRGKLIVENPISSSTGAAFLLWTVAVYGGDGFDDFWRDLKPTVHSVQAGWDTAYEAFLNGEAPMVVSYSLDTAYSVYYYNDTRYRAVIMEEGGYAQIEGMGIVKWSKHKDLAQKFIEFALTEDFQREIPLNNWMLPVNPNVELPEEIQQYGVFPERNLTIPAEDIAANFDSWVETWQEIMS
ncbi:MAG: thiamine ABC transporter substrate-binding protein [Thermoplasmata archaeon]|nr:MAG: thiamine ABC transporter substrate-binding protein [Thermoplasmata archaeon]RLF73196.1 MAG: thiamine ABC transporter substrate-binding protein [Thermoplasmata archaeon]HDD59620.1 thiamine ABC transporter substrate-binding protein [Euryarchaeota archaeon]